MPKVLIKYPQIVFDTKEVEVTEEQLTDLIEHHIDREKFIWDNLNEREQNQTFGEAWLEGAFDYGYISIKEVK